MSKKTAANASPAGLARQQSKVVAVSGDGTVFQGFYIWTDAAPSVKGNTDRMFAKCLVLPGSSNEKLKCKEVDPPRDEVFEVPQKVAYHYNSQLDPMNIGDIGLIPHTNVPCVLDFLQQRYVNKQIYSTADPLLVAMNPFKDLGNTTAAYITRYRDADDVARLPPHVFAVPRFAQENLHSVHKSQTILVCGESGAGKTEATKQIMRYLAARKEGGADNRIQDAVMSANPVLEAFGNAKTMRNNNSSRFGRFMQLQTEPAGGITYGSVRNFLLEKSRVVFQDSEERSYHVFYQLLKGASKQLKKECGLMTLHDYKFINSSCLDVDTIDDVKDFQEVWDSLLGVGFPENEVKEIFWFVSAVLLLGNVEVIGCEKLGIYDAADINPESMPALSRACELMGLNVADVIECLTVKYSKAGGEVVTSCWRKEESITLLQSLAKAIYEKLFFYIVVRLNETIEPAAGFKHFMGMLDIFGFEVFKNNSLEQLFINITNEMLQKNFIDIVFDREMKLYQKEGISAAELEWTSNAHIIAVLCDRKNSLMTVLEDQCLAPGGSDTKFVSACANALSKGGLFQQAKVGGNYNFMVAHTIGSIQYNATNFLIKNKDLLRAELVDVVQTSTRLTGSKLFEGVVMEKGKMAKGQLIGSQFLTSLLQLMAIIDTTEPHFIRCVKPNEDKAALKYVHSKVLIQLHSLSILEALQLRNLGYSYRRPFNEFLFQFKFVNLGVFENKTLEPSEATRKIFESAGIPKGAGWQIGKTMIFMIPDIMKLLATRQRERLASWDTVVAMLEAAFVRHKRSKLSQEVTPSAIRVQAHIRRIMTVRAISARA
eukprot:Lankesteria_metandrocarpae@DN3423_c0_g1_i1.p1